MGVLGVGHGGLGVELFRVDGGKLRVGTGLKSARPVEDVTRLQRANNHSNDRGHTPLRSGGMRTQHPHNTHRTKTPRDYVKRGEVIEQGVKAA